MTTTQTKHPKLADLSPQCGKVDAWTHTTDVKFGNIPDGQRERTVFWFDFHRSMIQYEAQRVANLIAAAPELLAEMEDAPEMDCWPDMTREELEQSLQGYVEWFHGKRAEVIRKAKGE